MQQSPSWEANRSSAHQEVPCILWNPMAHFRIHKCPPAVPILSQINPIHAFQPHLLNTHFISKLPLSLCVPSGLFPSVVPTKPQHAPLLSAIHATCPPTSFFFRHNMTMITNSKTNEQKYKITLTCLVSYCALYITTFFTSTTARFTCPANGGSVFLWIIGTSLYYRVWTPKVPRSLNCEVT